MNGSLVLVAIDAGVRIGSKVYEVLVDETFERPLVLPVGELYGSIEVADAVDYFDEHPELTRSGGVYAGARSRADKLAAYRTLFALGERVAGLPAAVEIVENLHRFEQYREGFGAHSPVKRLLGTVVEIGIDYIVANPLGKKQARKVVAAFVENLDETDFAEGEWSGILGDLLAASLRTLESGVSVVADGERLNALLGGITNALVDDVKAATSQADQLSRDRWVRRIGSSVLRGGLEALTTHGDLFFRDDETLQVLIRGTLAHVLEGVRGREDLFTGETLELVFHSALEAVGENTELFTRDEMLRDLISGVVSSLSDRRGKRIFAPETVASILGVALDVAGAHMDSLIDTSDPRRQLLAEALIAITHSFSRTLAGSGTIRELLTKRQMVELASVVLEEVARSPEKLLGGANSDPRRTALAQIIGSVARALSEDPHRFIAGEGFGELIRDTIRFTLLNLDKLLDLDTTSPKGNLLFKIYRQVVLAVEAGRQRPENRDLVSRWVFLEILREVLPVASANVEPLLARSSSEIERTVAAALELADGLLHNRINGGNLPEVIGELLRKVLLGELSLEEPNAVAVAATTLLDAA